VTTNVWCLWDKEKQTDTLLYEPKEGTIAPYSKTRVTFILNPKVWRCRLTLSNPN